MRHARRRAQPQLSLFSATQGGLWRAPLHAREAPAFTEGSGSRSAGSAGSQQAVAFNAGSADVCQHSGAATRSVPGRAEEEPPASVGPKI